MSDYISASDMEKELEAQGIKISLSRLRRIAPKLQGARLVTTPENRMRWEVPKVEFYKWVATRRPGWKRGRPRKQTTTN